VRHTGAPRKHAGKSRATSEQPDSPSSGASPTQRVEDRREFRQDCGQAHNQDGAHDFNGSPGPCARRCGDKKTPAERDSGRRVKMSGKAAAGGPEPVMGERSSDS